MPLVVIVGDHGQALGENSYFGYGLRLLESVSAASGPAPEDTADDLDEEERHRRRSLD